MRIISAIVLGAVGLLFTYWALVHGTHDPVEWVFVTAFVWMMCHDVWQRFFNRGSRSSEATWRSDSPVRRPHPRV